MTQTGRDRRQPRSKARIGATILALAGALSLPAVPAIAQQKPVASDALDAARAVFEALPEAERKAIQDALVWTGDYNGTVDGTFGKRTFDAMRAFETRSGLAADGILTPAERDALLAAARRERDAAASPSSTSRAAGSASACPRRCSPNAATRRAAPSFAPGAAAAP